MSTVIFVVNVDTHPVASFYIVADALEYIKDNLQRHVDIDYTTDILQWDYKKNILERAGIEYEIAEILLYDGPINQKVSYASSNLRHPLFPLLNENDADLYA